MHSLEKQNNGKEVNIVAPKTIAQLAESLPKRAVVPVGNIIYRKAFFFFFFMIL